MNTIHDEAHDTLREYMTGALGRVIDGLDAMDELNALDARRVADQDDWDGLSEGVQDMLRDHSVEPNEYGEWDQDEAREAAREDLEPLAITYEKGEPFDVALTLGGPNIYLVGFGGHGGAQLRGAWGSGWETMTGPDVTRAVEFYHEDMLELYGD